MLGIEFVNDLGLLERLFTARPAQCWIPNLDRNESDPTSHEVTADIFATGTGLLYTRQYTPVNEVQTVTLTGATFTAGTFTLTYMGQTTTGIAYNAANSAVQAALAALSTIGVGNVAVTGSAGGPYTVTLQGTLAGQENELLTGLGTGLTPSGTVVVVAA
jgi:hypothetical protein